MNEIESKNILIIHAFFDAMGRGTRAELREAYESFLHPECRYQNTGLPVLNTLQETMDFFFPDMNNPEGIQYIIVDVHHLSAHGNMVFTERTDHHYDHNGNDILTPLICGVFEVRDDLIFAWRDYFDPEPMLKLFDMTSKPTPHYHEHEGEEAL